MPKKQSNPSRAVPWGFGYVQQRGNRWQARWREPKPDGGFKWRAKSCFTEREANAHLLELGYDRKEGRVVGDPTVGELFDGWLRRGKNTWASSTYHNYKSLTKNHLRPEFEKRRVSELREADLQEWFDGLGDQELAPGTIHLIYTILASTLSQAVKLKLIRESPVHDLVLPKVRQPEPPAWSVKQVRTLLATVEPEPMWNALYTLALTTACRAGELLALRWSDIDTDRNLIHIRRTMTRNEYGRMVVGETTKGKEPRVVRLTASARVALARWSETQASLREDAGDDWDDQGFVLTTGTGRAIAHANWATKHRSLITKSGVPYLSLHGLRHTGATLDMETGAHPRVVQVKLGHKSIEQTMRYWHASAKLQKDAASDLDKLIRDKPKKAKKPQKEGNARS